jgi:hypothetical protein
LQARPDARCGRLGRGGGAQRRPLQLRVGSRAQQRGQHVEHDRYAARITRGVPVVHEQDVARREAVEQPLRDDARVARARVEAAARPARELQAELASTGSRNGLRSPAGARKNCGRVPVSSVSVCCAAAISRRSAAGPVNENV